MTYGHAERTAAGRVPPAPETGHQCVGAAAAAASVVHTQRPGCSDV
jgi:hypothetical protein